MEFKVEIINPCLTKYLEVAFLENEQAIAGEYGSTITTDFNVIDDGGHCGDRTFQFILTNMPEMGSFTGIVVADSDTPNTKRILFNTSVFFSG